MWHEPEDPLVALCGVWGIIKQTLSMTAVTITRELIPQGRNYSFYGLVSTE